MPGTLQVINITTFPHVFQSYHGFPTLEADAGLNVVVTSCTFLSAVKVQHPARESLQRQIACTFGTKDYR